MRKFAIFPALLGSDQLLHLDGRWGYQRIRRAVLEQAARHSRFRPSIKIRRAEIRCGEVPSRSHLLYEILFSEEDLKGL